MPGTAVAGGAPNCGGAVACPPKPLDDDPKLGSTGAVEPNPPKACAGAVDDPNVVAGCPAKAFMGADPKVGTDVITAAGAGPTLEAEPERGAEPNPPKTAGEGVGADEANAVAGPGAGPEEPKACGAGGAVATVKLKVPGAGAAAGNVLELNPA